MLLARVVPPATSDLPQLEATARLFVEGHQFRQGLGDDRLGHPNGLRQLKLGYRLGREQQ